jgi:hypothetical protein
MRYCLCVSAKPRGRTSRRALLSRDAEFGLADWGYVGPDGEYVSQLDEYSAPTLQGGVPPDTFFARGVVSDLRQRVVDDDLDEADAGAVAYLEVHFLYRRERDHVALLSLRVDAGVGHPPGGLVTDDLRVLRLFEVARIVHRLIEGGEVPVDEETGPVRTRRMPPKGWAAGMATRPGRRGRHDLDYARVAARYTAHLDSATPVADLAAELDVKPSQVRNSLYEARRRDLLTAAPKGKPGGSLTMKARRVLGLEGTGSDGNA